MQKKKTPETATASGLVPLGQIHKPSSEKTEADGVAGFRPTLEVVESDDGFSITASAPLPMVGEAVSAHRLSFVKDGRPVEYYRLAQTGGFRGRQKEMLTLPDGSAIAVWFTFEVAPA